MIDVTSLPSSERTAGNDHAGLKGLHIFLVAIDLDRGRTVGNHFDWRRILRALCRGLDEDVVRRNAMLRQVQLAFSRLHAAANAADQGDRDSCLIKCFLKITSRPTIMLPRPPPR